MGTPNYSPSRVREIARTEKLQGLRKGHRQALATVAAALGPDAATQLAEHVAIWGWSDPRPRPPAPREGVSLADAPTEACDSTPDTIAP
jgi:hypothetical protein